MENSELYRFQIPKLPTATTQEEEEETTHSSSFCCCFKSTKSTESSPPQSKSKSESSNDTPPPTLIITEGSVTEFTHSNGAIVNAANERCLGGGGIDGIISSAGGPTLLQHRRLLPEQEGVGGERRRGIRCPTGGAKITGPGRYGLLKVPYVIHAVGPIYSSLSDMIKESKSGGDNEKEGENVEEGENNNEINENNNKNEEIDEEQLNQLEWPEDELLKSAYTESLKRAEETGLDAIAFCLISAGIFSGDRDLNDVVSIGMKAILEFEEYHELKEVYMYGYTPEDQDALHHAVRTLALIDDHDDWNDDEEAIL